MTVVIALCLLLLVAYLFEFYSEKINVPTVMVLLLAGFLLREIITYFNPLSRSIFLIASPRQSWLAAYCSGSGSEH